MREGRAAQGQPQVLGGGHRGQLYLESNQLLGQGEQCGFWFLASAVWWQVIASQPRLINPEL